MTVEERNRLMDEALRPYLENLRLYGEIYPGATRDCLHAMRYRASRFPTQPFREE